MSFRVKEEYQSVVSVKSEYAVYDPVKDEETEEEEGDDLLEDDGKLSIKNEDDVNEKLTMMIRMMNAVLVVSWYIKCVWVNILVCGDI